MKILAVETSCDETAISLVKMTGGLGRPKFEVLAEEIASQVKVHAEFGGVVPNLAKREHEKNLPLLLERVLENPKSKTQPARTTEVIRSGGISKQIDAIAVTVGPGLEPALWVGINFARALSLAWNKPLIPVNHLAGHIYSPLARQSSKERRRPRSRLKFPALALIVSGGHTELVLVKDWYKHKVIGRTRDDAAGEAFDKVARLLGLPFPGGPALAKLADSFSKASPWESAVKGEALSLPRPMIHSGDFDFSFSGLKTAVLYQIKKLDWEARLPEFRSLASKAIAHEFQNAVVEVLVSKTKKAILKFKPQTLVIGGGVSANKMLRAEMQKLATETGVTFLLPAFTHSIDNATMIAVAGALLATTSPKSLKKPGTKLTAKGRLAL